MPVASLLKRPRVAYEGISRGSPTINAERETLRCRTSCARGNPMRLTAFELALSKLGSTLASTIDTISFSRADGAIRFGRRRPAIVDLVDVDSSSSA